VPTSEQSHVLKGGAPTGDPQQYDAYEIQNFFQNTDPSGVGVAGQGYQTTGGYALMIASDLDSQGKSIFEQWQGPAAIVAQQALAQLRNTAQQFGEACNNVGSALNDYSAKLATYKNMTWPAINSDVPPKPTQLAALNRAAQQAMTQANGDMQATWSAMPASLTSELPGISNPQSATSSSASGPGSSYYSPTSGSHNGATSPSGTVHQAAYVPPGTAHQPGSTAPVQPPGAPSHLSSVPPGPLPGPGAAPPPGPTTLPPGVSPPPGSAPPGPIGPGPILSSTPPPPPEDPNPGALPPGDQTALPPGEEPLPNMIRPFAPTAPVGSMPPNTGRPGPNTSVEAAAPVSQDFAGPGGQAGAMAAQDESLGLSAAEMGQRDMLGMPMAPMAPMGAGVPGSEGQSPSLSVTEGREVWSDEVELNSSVIGDAPNYLGLTGRRPVRPEPGARLSTVELERLLHDAVKVPGDPSGRGASIPGEISRK